MTDDVERFAFLLRQKPVCTHSPVKTILGKELHRELRAKYKLELGVDLLADRCPNSFNCIATGAGCIGRPFPIDEGIFNALSKLNVVVTKGIFKTREVYLAKSIVTCSECPFFKGCESACVTQESYLKKATKTDMSPTGLQLVSLEDYEHKVYGTHLFVEEWEGESDRSWIKAELPLDCLTERQRIIVEGILCEGKSQIRLAYELGLDQSTISRNYELGLANIYKFGKARKFIAHNVVDKEVRMYYIDNKSQSTIAEETGSNQQRVSRIITKWRRKWESI
jgi:hypothetical protein